MRRSTVTPATALAMLALIAGVSIASNGAAAQDDELTVAQCVDAWAASSAYGMCGDRYSSTPGGQTESVAAADDLCTIETSCVYFTPCTGLGGTRECGILFPQWRDTNWRGRLGDVHQVRNCDGVLRLSC